MVDGEGDVWTVVDRGRSRYRVSHVARREVSGPRYFSEQSFVNTECHESEVDPAMCVVEHQPMNDDMTEKTVRFDLDDFIGRECAQPSRGGKPVELGPAYFRRCVAPRVTKSPRPGWRSRQF